MTWEQKRNAAAIENAATMILVSGEVPTEGQVISFDHRFGDEGPNSWTRCRVEMSAEMIEAAKKDAAKLRRGYGI